jgi:hypothetical protein
MIKTVQDAVDALPVADWDSKGKDVAGAVEFLRRNPRKFSDFCRGVRDASDASNHVTPFYRLSLVLQEALEVK